MQNLLRELPFFDALGPLVMAAALWTGAHILFIGSEVGARLSEKYYLPACHAGLQKAQETAYRDHQMRLRRERDGRQAESRMANDVMGGLIRGYFGNEFADHYKDHPLLNPGKMMPGVESLLPKPSVPRLPANAMRDYCTCVIAESLGQRINTGLFSASLRFWKPQNITLLEGLKSGPVSTALCPAPQFISN